MSFQSLPMTKWKIKIKRVTQLAMEQSILGIFLRDRKTNTEISRKTRAIDAVKGAAILKLN